MAEALVKKIEEDFLVCAVCFEQLTDPVGLPCLHGFCFECLEKWFKAGENKTQVTCPACKSPAPLPKEGIRGFPGHFLVKNLKATVAMEKESKENACIRIRDQVRVKATCVRGRVKHQDIGIVTYVFSDGNIVVDFPREQGWLGLLSEVELVQAKDQCSEPCNLCGKPSQAHCLDCKEYLCNQCRQNHNAFKAMKGHKLVAASDVLSGKITSKGRHCETHGEPVRYYCESEMRQVCQDCVSLKICPIEHNRVSLSEAARKQKKSLCDLVIECKRSEAKTREPLYELAEWEKRLACSVEQAQSALEKVIEETNEKLKMLWSHKKKELRSYTSDNLSSIRQHKRIIDVRIKKIQEACDFVSKVTQQGSDHDITFNYASLSAALQKIKSTEPLVVDKSCGDLQYFDPGTSQDYLKFASLEQLFGSWINQVREFSTSQAFHGPQSIVYCPDGDMVITSRHDGVKVFSPDGTVKHTFHCAPKGVFDIARTPDDRYIITGKTKLLCYDKQGRQLSTITTSSPFRKGSRATTVAVDNKGRIIAGLEDDAISIYYADGTLESQFVTAAQPYHLSASSQDTMIVSFHDKTVQIIDYSGKVVKVLKPPAVLSLSQWAPGRTSFSSPDKTFYVINEGDGPYFIYGYNLEGEDEGMFLSMVDKPCGVDFSHDGNECFVLEENGLVRVFHKQ